MDLKKLLIILIIILALLTGALGVYNLFIKDRFSSENESEKVEENYSDSSQSAGPNLISQDPVVGTVIDGNKVKYYSKENGNVFTSNLDGSDSTPISSTDLFGLLNVLWAPSKTKVITIFEKDQGFEKYYYNYTTSQSIKLDKNIRWIDWSKTEDKIAYQYYNMLTEDNNISLANPDGTGWTNLMQTRMKDLIVEWPKPEIISLRTKPSGLAQSVLYTINQNNNDFEKVIAGTYGLTVLWSPQGDKILYSATNNQGTNLKLKLLEPEKNSTSEINLVTLPEKCVWSLDNRTIFCAVPKNIPSRAVLPDDYWKKTIIFSDDFWKINLDTGEAKQIYSAGAGSKMYNAKNLLLSPNEDYLLFVNQNDELLYSLEL